MVTKRTPRSGTAAKRTTTRRRTTRSRGYRTRRRTPRTSTTLGSAFALGLIALLTQASWPVRIGLVVIVLVAAAGYLVVRARQNGAQPEQPGQPAQAASESASESAAPPAPPTDAKDAQP